MNYVIKEKLKKIILERIRRIQAERNPENSEYPLTLTADVYPILPKHLNLSHRNSKKNLRLLAKRNSAALTKPVVFQGDYAKTGNTNLKTLRLKINKIDWPDEWRFPDTEIDRRLFLQNFRLSNLAIVMPFDEGGEEYQKLFPPEPETPVEIVFDDEESTEEESSSESSEEKSSTQNTAQALQDVFDMLDILEEDVQEEKEYEIATSIRNVKIALYKDIIESKKR